MSDKPNILFQEQPNNTKRITPIYDVRNNHTHELLGVIKWDSPGRAYLFFPGSLVKIGAGYLREILECINKLMAARI